MVNLCRGFAVCGTKERSIACVEMTREVKKTIKHHDSTVSVMDLVGEKNVSSVFFSNSLSLCLSLTMLSRAVRLL